MYIKYLHFLHFSLSSPTNILYEYNFALNPTNSSITFSPLPTMFSKGFFPTVVKSRDCVVNLMSFVLGHSVSNPISLRMSLQSTQC